MTRTIYYTATSLDGFLADAEGSLDWLFVQDQDPEGPLGYGEFIADIGALLMGATTYEWLLAHLAESGESWGYRQPCWVLTHRDLPQIAESVRFATADTPGEVRRLHGEVVEAAGDADVWLVGGGGIAATLAAAGLLDELMVSIAPVTLGSGKPLLAGRTDLRLTRLERNRDFACAWYDVVPRRTG